MGPPGRQSSPVGRGRGGAPRHPAGPSPGGRANPPAAGSPGRTPAPAPAPASRAAPGIPRTTAGPSPSGRVKAPRLQQPQCTATARRARPTLDGRSRWSGRVAVEPEFDRTARTPQRPELLSFDRERKDLHLGARGRAVLLLEGHGVPVGPATVGQLRTLLVAGHPDGALRRQVRRQGIEHPADAVDPPAGLVGDVLAAQLPQFVVEPPVLAASTPARSLVPATTPPPTTTTPARARSPAATSRATIRSRISRRVQLVAAKGRPARSQRRQRESGRRRKAPRPPRLATSDWGLRPRGASG